MALQGSNGNHEDTKTSFATSPLLDHSPKWVLHAKGTNPEEYTMKSSNENLGNVERSQGGPHGSRILIGPPFNTNTGV